MGPLCLITTLVYLALVDILIRVGLLYGQMRMGVFDASALNLI